jgi:hypothetical protein
MKKINKSLFYLIILSLIFPLLESCKKGENDPFLSLSSRKSRVEGTWTVSKMTATNTSSTLMGATALITNATMSYDGQTATAEVSAGSSGSTPTTSYDTMYYTSSYTFAKEGTFESTMDYDFPDYPDDDEVVKRTGVWTFSGGTGDIKNKENLILSTTALVLTETENGSTTTANYTYDGNYTEDYEGNAINSVYSIKQLKSKEMVLTFKEYNTDQSGNYSNTDYEITLTQQ